MRILLAWAAAFFVVASAAAQSAEDQYVRIYNVIQQADALSSSGQNEAALTKYLEAQTSLSRLHRQSPDWKANVVTFRLNYLSAKIAAISPKVPSITVTNTPLLPVPPRTPPNPAPTTAAPPTVAQPTPPPVVTPPKISTAESEQQVSALQAEVQRLQGDKSLLEAKLKEALATQPATVDARELIKAADKIKTLLQDNELLKTSLEEERKKPAPDAKVLDQTKLALAEANKKLSDQTTRADKLTVERQALQERVDTLTANAANGPNMAAMDGLKKSLEEANRKLSDQTESSRKVSEENAALQARVRTLMASAEAGDALRAENEMLKKQLAEAKTAPVVAGDGSKQLAAAQAQIAALRSDAEILRLEKTALQNRIKQMAAAPVGTTVLPVASRTEDLERIKRLEGERDDLQRKLDLANREAYGKNSKEVAAKIESLAGEITTLRARLGVLEARSVPYTPEELALFKGEDFSLKTGAVDPNAGKKPISQYPKDSEKLLAEADKLYSAGKFDLAEKKYLEILKLDDKNANTLANLAMIQVKLNHFDDAEKNIKQALAMAPEDGYSLLILGSTKFYQQKYDDAFDALSRAAKLDPKNAEVQNYLGLTLGHKGLRGPAEVAFRKAIQIDPTFGAAHNNLTVIYLGQKPPLVELARWHYQKAIAAGHPKNPDLEKKMQEASGGNGGSGASSPNGINGSSAR